MHGTLLVFFVLVPVVIGLATYLVPLMIGADADRACPASRPPRSGSSPSPGSRSSCPRSRPAARRRTAGPATRRGTLTQEGNGVRLWLMGLFLLALSVAASAVNLAATIRSLRAEGMDWAKTPLFAWSVYVWSCGDDRARAARRDRARPDPARAPVQRLVRLLPHRRPDRQAVARLAVRAVVRLRRARAGHRHPGRDRGRVRRPRDRKRAHARAGARRHRRPHARPRALPRLRRRHRQEAERRAADPRGDRDDPVGRRARAAEEDALAGPRRHPLDGAAAVRRRRHRPVRDRPALGARARDLRERAATGAGRRSASRTPTT